MSSVDSTLSFISTTSHGGGEVSKNFWHPPASRTPITLGKQLGSEFAAAVAADCSNALLLPEIVKAMPSPLGHVERAFLIELARIAGLT